MKLSKINSKKRATFATIIIAVSLSLGTTAAFAAPEVEVKAVAPIAATSKAATAKELAIKESISKDRAKKLRLEGAKSGQEIQTGPGKPGPGPQPPPIEPRRNTLKSNSAKDLKTDGNKSIPPTPAIDVQKPTQKQLGL
jgi:hypothetical protein